MPSFSATTGYVAIVAFTLAMVALSWWRSRRQPLGLSGFLVADRQVGTWSAALSIAGSWVWAPALFLSSQKAFQQGAAGLFWFTFANVLCLVVFAPLAVRIRRQLPKGYTLPELMRQRHGPAVHGAYLFQFFSLQVCSFAVQLVGGAAVFEQLTGVSFAVSAVLLTLGVVAYAWLGGMRASVATDVVQAGLILLVCALVVPWSITAAGGFGVVIAGLAGATGAFGNIFEPKVAYSFGIIVSLGLLAGPIGDQQHWQRAFSVEESKVQRAFLLAAALFAVVPLTLGLLGFLGAGLVSQGMLTISDPQLVGPTVVSHLLPRAALGLFLVMLLAGLTSTMDSALVAASSLGAIDVVKLVLGRGRQIGSERLLIASRRTVLVVAAAGLAIALIPGLKILHLFLFYGTLRAGTMLPTVLTLLRRNINPRALLVALVGGWLVGLPGFVYGSLVGNVHLKVASTVFVVLFSGLGTWLGSLGYREPAAPAASR